VASRLSLTVQGSKAQLLIHIPTALSRQQVHTPA